MACLRDGQVSCITLDPADYGLERATLAMLRGGDAAENAEITRSILRGAKGSRRDVVVLNAGMALTTAGAAGNLADGIAMATEAIDSGRAHRVLEDLIAFTRAVA